MCYITVEELRKKLSYYLKKSIDEDIYITNNKKEVISVLTNPHLKALQDVKQMINELDINDTSNMSDEEIIADAIDKK